MVSTWNRLSLGHDLSVSSSTPASRLSMGHDPFLHAIHSLCTYLVSPNLYYQLEPSTLLSVFTSMSQMPNGRREWKVSPIHTARLLERFLPSFLQSRMSPAPAPIRFLSLIALALGQTLGLCSGHSKALPLISPPSPPPFLLLSPFLFFPGYCFSVCFLRTVCLSLFGNLIKCTSAACVSEVQDQNLHWEVWDVWVL